MFTFNVVVLTGCGLIIVAKYFALFKVYKIWNACVRHTVRPCEWGIRYIDTGAGYKSLNIKRETHLD